MKHNEEGAKGNAKPASETAVYGSCPEKVWCLLSGGKDSMTTAHVLAESDRLAGCILLDTGISTPDHRAFVEEVCGEFGWVLEVYRTPYAYDDLVRRYGFPGPPMHGLFMNYLKGRGVRAFRKAHRGAALASGVRQSESARRFRNVGPEGEMEGVRVVSPIYDWTTSRVWDYMREHGLRRSPAYETVHLSGDCLCGAFSSREEVYLIEMFYPEVAVRLRSLERETGSFWGQYREGFGRQSRVESFTCGGCAGG